MLAFAPQIMQISSSPPGSSDCDRWQRLGALGASADKSAAHMLLSLQCCIPETTAEHAQRTVKLQLVLELVNIYLFGVHLIRWKQSSRCGPSGASLCSSFIVQAADFRQT